MSLLINEVVHEQSAEPLHSSYETRKPTVHCSKSMHQSLAKEGPICNWNLIGTSSCYAALLCNAQSLVMVLYFNRCGARLRYHQHPIKREPSKEIHGGSMFEPHLAMFFGNTLRLSKKERVVNCNNSLTQQTR